MLLVTVTTPPAWSSGLGAWCLCGHGVAAFLFPCCHPLHLQPRIWAVVCSQTCFAGKVIAPYQSTLLCPCLVLLPAPALSLGPPVLASLLPVAGKSCPDPVTQPARRAQLCHKVV